MLNPWIFIFKLVPTHLSISSLSYFLRWSSHRPLTMVLGALHTSRLCLVLAEVSEETKTKWLHLQSASPMAGLPPLLMSTKSVPCIWNGNAVRLLMHFTEHSETSFMALVWENQERRYYRTHRWREVQGESHSQAPWVNAKQALLSARFLTSFLHLFLYQCYLLWKEVNESTFFSRMWWDSKWATLLSHCLAHSK